MLDIPGIGQEQVNRYARKFLPLVQKACQHYEEMMGSERRPQDPNHQNVISISSDEGEFDLDAGSDDLGQSKASQGELSQ